MTVATYALNAHDDYTIGIEETKDGFGIFKTFDEAKERALEIMQQRHDDIGRAIDEFKD